MAAIDVLMPVKNGMPYLTEALESLLAQTFGDFRVLILDHGSDDGSTDVARDFQRKDSRFVHCPLPDARGLAGLLNAGLDLCTAPFVARQDADDISLPERFERSLAVMTSDPNIAVLGSSAEVIDAEGVYRHDLVMPTDPHGVLPYVFFFNPVAHPTVILSKAWIDRCGARYADDFLRVLPAERSIRVDNFAEDHFLFGQLALVAKVVNLPDKLIRYRWHGQNTSIKKYVDQVAATIKVARFLADCFCFLNKAGAFDPAPLSSPGQRLVKFDGRRDFEAEYAAMVAALTPVLGGHPGLSRQIDVRRIYANRNPAVMLARLAAFALKSWPSRDEWYPVFSCVFERLASQKPARTSDGGFTFR